MENIVSEIFEALGGATKIAQGTGFPVQTVHDWLNKGKPEIPPWRRREVLNFAASAGKLTNLSTDSLAYLQSQQRTIGSAAA